MTQITKEELKTLYFSSASGGILKIKKWYADNRLNILNNVSGNRLSEKVFRFLFPDKLYGCEMCGEVTKFINIKIGYATMCSKSCVTKKVWASKTAEMESERQRKRQETNIKKYGVKDPMQIKEIAKKISKSIESRTSEEKIKITKKRKATNLKKYGVEFPQQLLETQNKARITCLKTYGVENPSYSEECKEKRKQTHLKKFGVENAFQSEIIKEKIKKTNLKKYGVENPSQSPEIAEKKISTHLDNYGVEYPAQYFETYQKQQKNKYKRKEIELPSGNKVKLQGYEPFTLLNDLLFKYSVDDIVMGTTNMPEIWYFGLDNKKHRYFPDFYIPKDNLIIEVKSTYTMKLQLEKNFLKKNRCLEMGFDFEFRIYDDKMNLVDEKEFL